MMYTSCKVAGLIDEDSWHKAMMAKELSSGNISVQRPNPLAIDTDQRPGADDLVLRDISFCCTDPHPPLPHLHLRYMPASVGFRLGKRPWIAGVMELKGFGRLHRQTRSLATFAVGHLSSVPVTAAEALTVNILFGDCLPSLRKVAKIDPYSLTDPSARYKTFDPIEEREKGRGTIQLRHAQIGYK